MAARHSVDKFDNETIWTRFSVTVTTLIISITSPYQTQLSLPIMIVGNEMISVAKPHVKCFTLQALITCSQHQTFSKYHYHYIQISGIP